MDLQFLPEFKNGKPYKRYTRLCQKFTTCKILKFLSTDTFGRLDGNGHISTLLTDGPNPSSTVKSIHPNVGILLCWNYPIDPMPQQNRVLTVREYARLQGFPDSYVFGDPSNCESSSITEVQFSCGFLCWLRRLTFHSETAIQTDWKCCPGPSRSGPWEGNWKGRCSNVGGW